LTMEVKRWNMKRWSLGVGLMLEVLSYINIKGETVEFRCRLTMEHETLEFRCRLTIEVKRWRMKGGVWV